MQTFDINENNGIVSSSVISAFARHSASSLWSQVPSLLHTSGLQERKPSLDFSQKAPSLEFGLKNLKLHAVKQANIAFWEGPLCPFTCYRAVYEKSIHDLIEIFEKVLEAMKENGKIDFEISRNFDGCEIFGRVYGKYNSSQFTIAFYYYGNDKDYIVQIRRVYGEGFTHSGFVDEVMLQVTELGVVIQSKEYGEHSFASFGVASLDNSLDLSLDFSDLSDLDELMEGEELDVDMCEKNSNEQVKRWIGVVTDRQSYQEEYRDSILRLREKCEDDKSVVMFLLQSDEKIVSKLLDPISKDFFDTFIIFNVLAVIHCILSVMQSQKSGVKMGEESVKTISHLESMWRTSPRHNVGSMVVQFSPSQQVVTMAHKCLQILKA